LYEPEDIVLTVPPGAYYTHSVGLATVDVVKPLRTESGQRQ